MKKALCIILAAFAVLSVFAACGKTEKKEVEEPTSEQWTPDSAAEEYYANTVTQENGDTTIMMEVIYEAYVCQGGRSLLNHNKRRGKRRIYDRIL